MAAAGIILLMTLFLLTNRDDIHTHTQEHAKTVTKEEEKRNNKPRVWKRLFGISHGNLNFLLLYMHLIALRRAFGCFS